MCGRSQFIYMKEGKKLEKRPLMEPAIMTKSTTKRFTMVKKLFANEDSLAPKASAAEKKIVNCINRFHDAQLRNELQ